MTIGANISYTNTVFSLIVQVTGKIFSQLQARLANYNQLIMHSQRNFTQYGEYDKLLS